jgi:hypothetical protein
LVHEFKGSAVQEVRVQEVRGSGLRVHWEFRGSRLELQNLNPRTSEPEPPEPLNPNLLNP